MSIPLGVVVEIHFDQEDIGTTPSVSVTLMRVLDDDDLQWIDLYSADLPGDPVDQVVKFMTISSVRHRRFFHHRGGRIYIAYNFPNQLLPAAGLYVVTTSVNNEVRGNAAFWVVADD